MSFADAILAALPALISASGVVWLVACLALVTASASESAEPAEASPERGSFSFIGGVAAITAPFLLLVHAFEAVVPPPPEYGEPGIVNAASLIPHETLAALGVVAAVLLFVPSLMGWVVSRAAPTAGLTLFRYAPLLNSAALVLTIYATLRSVLRVLEWAVLGGAI